MRAARGEVTGSVDRSIVLTDTNTALITDSTADLPDSMKVANIRIVPVPVSFGTEAFDVSTASDNAAFYERLATGGQNATTAAPSMGDLVEQYRRALESYEFAVVLHMSTTFSTADVARRAALEVDPDRIFAIEMESVPNQLALIVARASRAQAWHHPRRRRGSGRRIPSNARHGVSAWPAWTTSSVADASARDARSWATCSACDRSCRSSVVRSTSTQRCAAPIA